MKSISRHKYIAAVASFAALICVCAKADDINPVKIGDQAGYVKTADGPLAVSVDMEDCTFDMQLSKNQHIKYNGPDIIFYDATQVASDGILPYLLQAQMSSGYSWSFKTRGHADLKWFGMMCENKSDFYWSANKKSLDDQTPETQQIMEDNSDRCPADFKNGKFSPNKKTKNLIFRPIDNNQWSGFIYGNPSKRDRSTLAYAGFCLIHNDSVIIGSMYDPDKNLTVPISFLDEISDSLSTLKFTDK
ncbi:hypothetical protein B0G62_102113 [Paraburkholderia eburnea]|uniref:Secreted protein n=1 Tax=Paraburkholderia eburnea TaxID=1189126 RepID=A0A2S4MIP6_9BURK|nr:hypothetical protein [Paraburkholderia eburnea]POR54505.1 hypothetical protein B0G62_102113 [Paraburkholderia eburnea]PRZ19720.1 hypothetical protein BX588_114113 [Paraburkholderia eburnea]